MLGHEANEMALRAGVSWQPPEVTRTEGNTHQSFGEGDNIVFNADVNGTAETAQVCLRKRLGGSARDNTVCESVLVSTNSRAESPQPAQRCT